MLEWLGSRVGVYGYGKTGKACVDYLAPRLVYPLVFVDETDAAKLEALQAEAGDTCRIVGGDTAAELMAGLDSLVLSPGVPPGNPNVQRARAAGVMITGELELSARYCPGYIIAITGTNGKSTTTKLLGHILEGVGPVHVLGNIGAPLLGSLDEIGPGDFVALEVSSYQLETIQDFKPSIAIYTNLTPDHMDRHGSVEEYAAVKRGMIRNMGPESFVITNARVAEFAPEAFHNKQPSFLRYSIAEEPLNHGAYVDGSQIVVELGAETIRVPLACLKLPGKHNLENALAAITAAALAGASAATIASRLSTFTGYEHRLEICRVAGAVKFYNDSKATNPEATITALQAVEGPLVLILGGRDKLTSLGELLELVREKATAVVLIGEATERFAAELSAIGYNSVYRAAGLEEAVPAAVEALKGSGSILLSPACASFDQYASFEQRGEHFKQVVGALRL